MPGWEPGTWGLVMGGEERAYDGDDFGLDCGGEDGDEFVEAGEVELREVMR